MKSAIHNHNYIHKYKIKEILIKYIEEIDEIKKIKINCKCFLYILIKTFMFSSHFPLHHY